MTIFYVLNNSHNSLSHVILSLPPSTFFLLSSVSINMYQSLTHMQLDMFHISFYMRICAHKCMHTQTYITTHTHLDLEKHTPTHAHMQAHAHAHTHTHTHIHTHTLHTHNKHYEEKATNINVTNLRQPIRTET